MLDLPFRTCITRNQSRPSESWTKIPAQISFLANRNEGLRNSVATIILDPATVLAKIERVSQQSKRESDTISKEIDAQPVKHDRASRHTHGQVSQIDSYRFRCLTQPSLLIKNYQIKIKSYLENLINFSVIYRFIGLRQEITEICYINRKHRSN